MIIGICHWNNKPFKEVSKPLDGNSGPPSANICKMVTKYRGLRRNLISMCIVWFGMSFGLYGMIYNTPTSQSNVYLVFMMPAFGSMVNIILNPILQRKIGRKIMLTGPLVVSGILIVIAAFAIPKVTI